MRVSSGASKAAERARAGDEIFLLRAPAAHPGVDELPLPPDGVHPERLAGHRVAGPVREAEQRPVLQLLHAGTN